jgi:hypothetical protein
MPSSLAPARATAVAGIAKRVRPSSSDDAVSACSNSKAMRRVYDAAFKLRVVEYALKLPPDARIKPTCRAHPGVEPVRIAALWTLPSSCSCDVYTPSSCPFCHLQVQVRKWIRNHAALRTARPNAKLVLKARAVGQSRVPSPTASEDSDTESIAPPETPPPSRASSLRETPVVVSPAATLEHTEDVRAAQDLLLLLTGIGGY